MTRSINGILAWLLLVVAVKFAEAQQPKTLPYHLGYLSSTEPTRDLDRSHGIATSLRHLGYIEGQNIVTEYRYAVGKMDQLPTLASDLVRLNVAVIIVSGGNAVIRAAKNATTAIPLVLGGQGSDPVEAGFVESLAQPAGNITGVTNLLVQLGGKRLELLKEAAPKIVRVTAPYVVENRTHELELKSAKAAAHALGITIQPREVRGGGDFDRVFASIGKQRPDGLHVPGGPVMRDNEKRIVDFALRTRLPSMFTTTTAVKTGGLMYYGPDLTDSYRRVATYVDRILKGAKPGDLPVEQPTKFELVINLKTAKQIGLPIPPNLLARADKVVK